MYTKKQKDIQIVVYSFNGTQLSSKKQQTADVHNNMDESQ